MTKILLDTQVLYWRSADSSKLGDLSKDLIRNFIDVRASTISLFELLQKQRVGKLSQQIDILGSDFIGEFEFESIDEATLDAYRQLPKMAWKDPFDHLLVAQAISLKAALLTSDQQILNCKIPHLKVIDAKK